MNPEKKILFLFTDRYPYDLGEQFIANEIPFLSSKFLRIYSFPMKKVDHQKRVYPSNLSPAFLFEDSGYNHWFEYLSNLPLILGILFTEFIHSKQKYVFARGIRSNLRILLNAVSMAEAVKRFMKKKNIDKDSVVCYSYWFYDWAIALSLLKAKGIIHGYISRTHLGDLFDNITPGRVIPFQYYKIKSSDRIFSVSKNGLDYSKNRYPGLADRFECRYLGVEDAGLNPVEIPHTFTLVSCSSLTSRKRVDRIPGILMNIDFELNWIHFGSGPEMENIKKLVSGLPKNIKTDLKGYVRNEEMKKYFKTVPVDLFINVSEAEGIPVSLMEAASFGVPMMATDIYGNGEIVNESNGILLKGEFDPVVAAEKIRKFVLDNNPAEKRKEARRMFEESFHDVKNYTLFVDELKKNV